MNNTFSGTRCVCWAARILSRPNAINAAILTLNRYDTKTSLWGSKNLFMMIVHTTMKRVPMSAKGNPDFELDRFRPEYIFKKLVYLHYTTQGR